MTTTQIRAAKRTLPDRWLRFCGRFARSCGSLLYETFCAWQADKAPTLAAALAFYTLFTLTPVLLVAISIAGFVFGPDAAQSVVLERVRDAAGEPGVRVVSAVLRSVAESRAAFATSFAAVLLGATAAFVHLQASLNTIWEVMPPPDRLFKNLMKARLFSFLMVLGIGFVLILFMTTSTALTVLQTLFPQPQQAPGLLSRLYHFFISPIALMVLIGLTYKILPDARVRWRDVWVGAAVTSVLFTAGSSAIRFYLATTSLRSLYGAAGSLIIFILWVYVSAQIFFFGAEFTHVYARKHGTPIVPKGKAVRFTRQVHSE